MAWPGTNGWPRTVPARACSRANVGRILLEPGLQPFPLQSMQAALAKNAFGLYDNVSIRPATKAYCVSLERAAVWESEHVDLRIADFYRSKANSWEGHLWL